MLTQFFSILKNKVTIELRTQKIREFLKLTLYIQYAHRLFRVPNRTFDEPNYERTFLGLPIKHGSVRFKLKVKKSMRVLHIFVFLIFITHG
jgi:hypothetical protein